MANRGRTFGEKVVSFIAILCVLLTIIIVLFLFWGNDSNRTDWEMAETPISIEKIKNTGKLLLSSMYVEEMEYDEIKGSLKTCKCVQTLSQEVWYVLDLSKIEYDFDSDNIYLTLPEIEIEYKDQDSNHYSENDDFERKKMYNPNPLINKVRAKIKQKCEIPENMQKAEERARYVLRELYDISGKNVLFPESLPLSTE